MIDYHRQKGGNKVWLYMWWGTILFLIQIGGWTDEYQHWEETHCNLICGKEKVNTSGALCRSNAEKFLCRWLCDGNGYPCKVRGRCAAYHRAEEGTAEGAAAEVDRNWRIKINNSAWAVWFGRSFWLSIKRYLRWIHNGAPPQTPLKGHISLKDPILVNIIKSTHLLFFWL